MITDLGQIAVIFALAASIYAAVISHLGAQRNDDRLVQSGRLAAMMGLYCAFFSGNLRSRKKFTTVVRSLLTLRATSSAERPTSCMSR